MCKKTLTVLKVCKNIHSACMCSKQWKVGYHNLHASFGVPGLSDHRLYLNLCMMYKIIHKAK